MDIDDYLIYVAEFIKRAKLTNNKEETIRLIALVRDTCNDTLQKLQRGE